MTKKTHLTDSSYGKNINHGKVPEDAEVQFSDCSPVLEVRSQKGVYEKVRSLPYLFPRARLERGDPGGEEVIVVVIKRVGGKSFYYDRLLTQS